MDGSGEAIDLEPIEELARTLEEELGSFRASGNTDSDFFEGQIAGRVHVALAHLPISLLDDPGFWRYLALKDFWWLVTWRESKAFDSNDPRRYAVYIDGSRSSECIPLRIFLRGQVANDNGDYSLAVAVPEATDFWRSHIIRVTTWSVPHLARKFIRMQEENRLTTQPLRRVARLLNRRRANVALHQYSEAEIAALLNEVSSDL